jgi:hypothetical protein
MPNHKYCGNQIFHCIDVLDDSCGAIGRINQRINNLIIVSGTRYILSQSFDVGGNTHDDFYYPTKDSNQLGDTYNKDRFEEGKFIRHIYTTTASTNITNIILEYDIYMEHPHDVTIDICEVKHDVYAGTELTDLPSIHSETISLLAGNSKGNFTTNVSFSSNKTLTVRMKFIETGGSHGNDQVTMACTLYGTS